MKTNCGRWLGMGLGLVTLLHEGWAAGAVPVLPLDPLELLPLQRSLSLMAVSGVSVNDEVRVLFYGQSIVQQRWARQVATDLRRAFPLARLVIENRAIPSFNANYLLKTAEADVYPFRPDLILCHCYGPYGAGRAWEQLWEAFRTRTTADLVMIGNHITVPRQVNELVDRSQQSPFDSEWWLNYQFAPGVARRVGACFPDNRSQWRAYLQTHGLAVADLVEDNVHLNALGNELQAAIVSSYVTGPRLEPPVDPFDNARVRTVFVRDDGLQWTNGRLRLEFVGNRIDALSGPGRRLGCRVLVDGMIPTDLPSGTGHGRSSGWPLTPWWLALLHIGTQRPLEAEKWTLTVTRIDLSRPHEFEFDVGGSVTGPDGSGSTTNQFISNSGRVVIGPGDWDFQQLPFAVGVGTEVTWNSEVRAVSRYDPGDTAPGTATTLSNDLPDGPHVLELIADDPDEPPSLAALRVYHPGGATPGTEFSGAAPPLLRYLTLGDQWLTVWPAAATGWQLNAQSSLGASRIPWAEPPTNAHGFRGHLGRTGGEAGFFQLVPSVEW